MTDENPVEDVLISDALKEMLAAKGLSDTAVFSEIARCWQELTGPEVAANVRPRSLRGRELAVEVRDPAWATEVRLSSQVLLSRLSERLGESAPQRLAVRVANRFHEHDNGC